MTTDWMLFDALRAEADYRAEQMGRAAGRTDAVAPVRRRLPWTGRANTAARRIPRPRSPEWEQHTVSVVRRRDR
jgi:hypothetical protein